MTAVKKNDSQVSTSYDHFDQIDGSHPLKEAVSEAFIDYPARIRPHGKIAYFNFELAKEMGLIPKSHNHSLNSDLETKLLETFSIQIINEFDQMKNKKFKPETIKSGTYMATRYLQMQHPDKKGLSSGDGRSVWLGHINHKGKSWDISACGTGATRLSPATSKFNKFFETGDPSISYGCGYGELDEGLATSLMSYIFKENNMETEETLCVVEFKNNISINIRVSHDLFRPSHFFLYLKQDNLETLRKMTDFYIDRNRKNDDWSDCPKGRGKYKFLLNKVCSTFSTISANFEDEYLFCWLDWDGDNILMNGGLIDYGSIRKFGIMHHEYRYDDVERFSTSLLEQKVKAKYMVQTFAQIVDYLETGKKKNIQDFSEASCLKDFESQYLDTKNKNLLNKMGFSDKKVRQLLKRERKLIERFRKNFSYFERAKSRTGMIKVSDGMTCDAIFNMGNILRELPKILLTGMSELNESDFIEIIKSAFATEDDLSPSSYRAKKIKEFQKDYTLLIKKCAKYFQEDINETILSLSILASRKNKANKITGDAITHIIALLAKDKKLNADSLFEFITALGAEQKEKGEAQLIAEDERSELFKKAMKIIKDNREGI